MASAPTAMLSGSACAGSRVSPTSCSLVLTAYSRRHTPAQPSPRYAVCRRSSPAPLASRPTRGSLSTGSAVHFLLLPSLANTLVRLRASSTANTLPRRTASRGGYSNRHTPSHMASPSVSQPISPSASILNEVTTFSKGRRATRPSSNAKGFSKSMREIEHASGAAEDATTVTSRLAAPSAAHATTLPIPILHSPLEELLMSPCCVFVDGRKEV